jgi:hypothetical protein
MRRILFVVGIFLWAVMSFPRAAGAAMSSKDLIAHARGYDGQAVIFEGELIRGVLPRGDHAWCNLNDGANAIGVWVPRPATAGVRYAGRYQVRGDWIRVQGVFHRACPEHQGALDIHADALLVVRPGGPVPDVLQRSKVFSLAVLLGVLVCLLIFKILNRKRAQP